MVLSADVIVISGLCSTGGRPPSPGGGLPPGLRCERITRTQDGLPLLLSEHVFPGHRTEFVVEMPRAEPSISPSGLRLVEDQS